MDIVLDKDQDLCTVITISSNDEDGKDYYQEYKYRPNNNTLATNKTKSIFTDNSMETARKRSRSIYYVSSGSEEDDNDRSEILICDDSNSDDDFIQTSTAWQRSRVYTRPRRGIRIGPQTKRRNIFLSSESNDDLPDLKALPPRSPSYSSSIAPSSDDDLPNWKALPRSPSYSASIAPSSDYDVPNLKALPAKSPSYSASIAPSSDDGLSNWKALPKPPSYSASLSSLSDDGLPNWKALPRKLPNPLSIASSFCLKKGNKSCICALKKEDKIICSSYTLIQDHMLLKLRPCNQCSSSGAYNALSPYQYSGSDGSLQPCKLISSRRRISEEKQAGSSPVTESVTHYSDKFEEEDTIQRILTEDSVRNDVYGQKKKWRISCERQAASLPFKPVSPGLLNLVDSSSFVFNEEEEKRFMNRESPSSQTTVIYSEDSSSFMFNEEEEKKLIKGKGPSSPIRIIDSEVKDVQKINVYSSSIVRASARNSTAQNNNLFYYLERNKLLCPYRLTYLPSPISQSTNTLSYLQSSFMNVSFDNSVSAGLRILEDLSSQHIPDKDLVDKLVDVIFNQDKEVRDLNQIYSTLLSLLQSIPTLVTLSEDQVRSVISDIKKNNHDKKVTSFILPILFIIQLFEMDIFSRNFCDGGKIRKSLSHSYLSLDENKQIVTLVLREIENCAHTHRNKKKIISKIMIEADDVLLGKYEWLSSLQHLIHLGILTVKNRISSCHIIAKHLRPIVMDLSVQDQIIFLESIEHPLLCISMIMEVMESMYTPIVSQEMCPSIKTVIRYFMFTAYSMSKVLQTAVKYEELVVLLYYSIRSLIACQQDYILEPMRKRILRQSGDELVTISSKEKYLLLGYLDRILYDLHRVCHKLTPTTFQFFLYSKCLITNVGGI